MKFSNDANIHGTSYKGIIRAYYHELVEVFGLPDRGPDNYDADKVTCEWNLQFEDGTVATIYDWKESETPMGQYDWHIGGKSFEAVERVFETMGK